MSSLIAARTISLAGISGRFTASGGFLYRNERRSWWRSWWRPRTGRKPGHTHSGRKSLWILCKGQLFRSTNDRSMHSKSACITTHRYFLCTVSQWILFVLRYALRSLCALHVCVCVSRLAPISRIVPAAIYRFLLFSLSLFLWSFHWRIVVKLYVKSSWKRVSLPYIGGG